MDSLTTIKEIEQKLSYHKDSITLLGVSDGLLGYSLFYYYHFLLTHDEISFNKIIYYLEKAIGKLDESYQSHKVQIEIIEAGLYLLFLNENNLLDIEEVEDILNVFDQTIETFLIKKIAENDLDYTIGALRAGLYFKQRNNFKSKNLLKSVLDSIEKLSIIRNDNCYWNFPLRNSEKPKIEIGLGHGVCGVIIFLLQLYESGFEKEKCIYFIEKATHFVLNQKRENGISLFKINAFEEDFLDYNNLSYGDIGIGYVLLRVGQTLNKQSIKEEAIKILENASMYRDESELFIRDANIIYGASGLYSIFSLLYELTENEKFLESKKYWLNKTLSFNKKDDKKEWAGFKTYFNGAYEFAQLGFSQGIAGIGIALITKEMGISSDYLKLLNYN